MSNSGSTIYRLGIQHLESLFDAFKKDQYQNICPVARDGAIMLDEILAFDHLAKGCYETQGKGSYQLTSKEDDSLFGYTVGPQSFKKYLNPPRRKLWSASGSNGSFEIDHPSLPPKMVFWGVRNCDLTAIRSLDRIFLKGNVVNEWYKLVREDLFIISAGCVNPSENCFCTTMEGGPSPNGDFDISLLEILNDGEHYFLAEFKSKRARGLFDPSQFPLATADEIKVGESSMQTAVEKMQLRFKPTEVADMLRRDQEHSQWDDIATRCMSCANCTMVCPTCFCTTTEDITDITGEHTARWLSWDSCFNGNFSYLHGGQVRTKTSSNYRQWMSHKLSTWYDQFGSSGCVGCGRCITWCPVGIDLTEEVTRMQGSVGKSKKEKSSKYI